MMVKMMEKKIYCKEIQDYIDYASNNSNKISEDIKLCIENIVKPTLSRDDVIFDEKVFQDCIKFCEKWFYPLFPYQKFIYAFFFMYEKETPSLVIFSEILILMGRGNGKDGMLMPLCCFLLTHYYGIKNYNIDIVATSEEQAINTFNVVYNMLDENKTVMKKYFEWNKTEIRNKKTNSKLRYNTSNAKTKDGKQTGMILFNEYHAYEDYKQINVYSSGLGKIEHARTVIITTNGTVREGPLDEKISISESVLRGEDNFLNLLPFLYRLKKREDVDKAFAKFLETKDKKDINLDILCQANPSLEYREVLKNEIIKDYLKMQQQKSYRTEFYAKRVNLPEQDEDEVAIEWNKILKASFKNVEEKIPRDFNVKDGEDAIVGIDFADLNDFASVGLLFKIENEIIWRHHTWICCKSRFYKDIKFPFANIGLDGFNDFEVVNTESINARDIVLYVLKYIGKYNIKKIVLDSYRYKLLEQTFKEFNVSVETRDNPNGLIRMVRYPASIAAIVAPQLEVEFSNGNINIGDSALMRWSINNTGVKTGRDGNKAYYKIEPKLRKNDPFMAFVVAMSVINLLVKEVIYV